MLHTHLHLNVEEKKGYPNSFSRYADLKISIFLEN